ncbi:D-alanyl-D-alanine carboxypeptidase/D-alanyl-D-alanine-endopeptidase [Prevotella sp. S7 MS 2]|uniref:D-alanyl-D-alanine carboxypeptidase/D-alanyl-D-alanine-endopeptidase n=1 Tax=Prevotella sp. S7 MS 2 TaxID=1287488 RepID=UPI0006916E7E|nr:D-alanyl-D-alanine carboxypeptidase [Prevotella sp. S7 MS 2]
MSRRIIDNRLYSPLHVIVVLVVIFLFYACGNDNRTKEKRQSLVSENVEIDNALYERLVEFAAKPRAKGNFGFFVYDLTADKPVYGVNENVAQSSASCLKLLSGVAGLQLLGTKYLYTTSLYTCGTVSDGILHGDLGFRADLDPQLQGTDFTMFAKELKRRGIKKISGKIRLDLLLHKPVQSEKHWYPWDLSFSHYSILYKGAPRVIRDFKSSLRFYGIQVADNQFVIAKISKKFHCIFRFYRSIDRVTRRMWKNSSNTQATSMLYTIGHRVNPDIEPTIAGVQYLKTFLKDTLQLHDSTLVVHDGCGLCTHNHLSPVALTAILRYGYQHKSIFRMLYNQLSIAGVDGTLRREMSSSKLRGKVRAKTGTLSHPYGISSLAGYCIGSNGHLLAFAIMDTDMSVLDARVLQRKLCEALVQ